MRLCFRIPGKRLRATLSLPTFDAKAEESEKDIRDFNS